MSRIYFASMEAVDDQIAELRRLREKMARDGAPETRAAATALPLKDKAYFQFTFLPREGDGLPPLPHKRVNIDELALEAAQRIHTQTIAEIQCTVIETIKRYYPDT